VLHSDVNEGTNLTSTLLKKRSQAERRMLWFGLGFEYIHKGSGGGSSVLSMVMFKRWNLVGGDWVFQPTALWRDNVVLMGLWIFFFFFFGGTGVCTCYAGALLLEPCPQPWDPGF
jgi:hypothetical protein